MQTPWLERRVSALISAYADSAPVAVDPFAVARFAAASSGRRWWSTPADRGLAFVGAVVLLVVAITVGAVAVGADPFRRQPNDFLTRSGFVEPFIGLPPEGAPPSSPESGDLVFSFYGRVDSIGLDFHRTSLYADGRLIWTRNLDWRTDPNPGRVRGGEVVGTPAFGGMEPTTAVIEQRLTPEGVEALRSEVMATARTVGPYRSDEDINAQGPGVLWGGMTINVANERFVATWSDPGLPGRLADPESWLPAAVWADQRIAGYVPARYAYCYDTPVDAGWAMQALPVSAHEVLVGPATTVVAAGQNGPRCPYRVSLDGARALSGALEEAGMVRETGAHSIGYRVTEPGRPEGAFFTVYLLPVLPDGDIVCECG